MGINFPNAPTVNQLWPQPPVVGQPVYRWDGAKWTTQGSASGAMIYVSDTAPTGALDGSMWWKSDQGLMFIRFNDGDSSQWVMAMPVADATRYAVRFDTAQTLSAPQQLQARQNLGIASVVQRSYLAGLTLSTAGSSATFSVAVGAAADSTNADVMSLASAISKTTGAWAVGTGVGGLDTGAIAVNTWYHVYLIKRPDTGVVDVLVSTSATAPTLPANYTLFRRIGSIKTNVSSQWTLFTQFGDDFIWSTVVLDVNVTNFSNTPTLYTLGSVPQGFQVLARIRIGAFSATTALASLFTSPDEASSAAGAPAGNYNCNSPAANTVGAGSDYLIRTNTVAQIRGVAASGTTNTLQLVTVGWVDRRGRDT